MTETSVVRSTPPGPRGNQGTPMRSTSTVGYRGLRGDPPAPRRESTGVRDRVLEQIGSIPWGIQNAPPLLGRGIKRLSSGSGHRFQRILFPRSGDAERGKVQPRRAHPKEVRPVLGCARPVLDPARPVAPLLLPTLVRMGSAQVQDGLLHGAAGEARVEHECVNRWVCPPGQVVSMHLDGDQDVLLNVREARRRDRAHHREMTRNDTRALARKSPACYQRSVSVLKPWACRPKQCPGLFSFSTGRAHG